jgi:starch-binding outer membrane protein, SusD/RagB family
MLNFKKMKMKNILIKTIKPVFAIALLAVISVSCLTDIEESDSIITDEELGIFDGVGVVQPSLDNLYNGIYGQLGDQANFFALNEVSTDETLVPTRGTDWGDNGIWRTLHAHTWSPTHSYLLATWNQLNQNVFRASEIIASTNETATVQQAAEAKFLRAFSMYFVLDFWGQVPFRQPGEGSDVDPLVLLPQQAYNFILDDISSAIAGLPATGPSADNNKATRAAANFLKAKVVLNASRYDASGNMQDVINAVDAIAADGYGLQAGYFELFLEDVDNETIWFASTSVGNRIWNGLHYNQNSPDNEGGGWNGFTTLAEFYDSFEGNANSNNIGDGQEERRGWVPDASNSNSDNLGIGYGFLVGQQYEEDGTILRARPGDPLIFTKELPGLSGNNERTGIRIIKYHPSDKDGGSFRSHEIVFRYADAHLMKAEAMMRSGGDATAMVNELRTLRGASPLGNVGEAQMLAERGRELYVEFWRRNDLLRFGKFTMDWEFKDPNSVGDETKNLYPIPINALLSNPNLVQNEGY